MSRPTLPRMLVRGLFRRCAWCGHRGAFFDGWFKKSEACHGCGLGWRRGDVGFELGAAAIAAIICMGPLVISLGVTVALTWPEMNVLAMLIVLGAGAVILPVLLYPSSYTIWQGIDILMRPVKKRDFVASGQEAPSGTNGRAESGSSADSESVLDEST